MSTSILLHASAGDEPLLIAVRLPSMPGDEAVAFGRLLAECPLLARFTTDCQSGAVAMVHVENTGDLAGNIAAAHDAVVRAWTGQ